MNELVIYFDGIGTSKIPDSADDGRSILRPVAQAVADSLGGEVLRAEWSASMAGLGPDDWRTSSEQAIASLERILAEHPSRDVVLLAYSGGNLPLHDWLDRNAGKPVLDRVKAVGFMSDPFRPRDKYQFDTPRPGGYGVCGQRHTPIDDRAFWSTVAGDVISDAPHDTPLRTLADISDAMPGRFLYDLSGHLGRGDLQLAWQLGVLRRNPLAWLRGLGPRLDRARREVEGYLGGQHTTMYHRPLVTRRQDDTEDRRTPAQRLAGTVAWAVKVRR